MKENAPKKIYVPRLKGNETFVHEWSATKFKRYFSREIAENIEYTRTDAFIEKACEFLKSYRQDTLDGTGYIAGIINDKTIDDFVNYMKGE